MSQKITVDLGGLKKTKTIELPSFKGSEVEVFTSLSLADKRAVEDEGGILDKALAIARISIKDWNLYKDEENKLPITAETLEKFNDEDVLEIVATAIGTTRKDLMEKAKDQQNNDPKA